MTMAPSTQWPVQRLKFVASVMPSNVDKLTDPDHIPVRLCNYVDVYKYDRITGDMEFMPASATPAQITRFALRGGDVLITKDSETPDDIAVPAYVDSSAAGVVCGYHLALLRPIAGRTIGRYLFWAICSRSVSSAFSARAQGITRFGLTVGAMGDVPIPLPPTAEQRAIADFLDRETAKIDALIATQARLIALLDEKRQATITHAVTKGLDPTAPMKESGVEWLRDIPRNWALMAVKRVAMLKSGDTISADSVVSDGTYPVYGGNGFRGYTDRFTHEGNYLLIGRQGALCGNINYASGQFWASEHAIVVTLTKTVSQAWLGYVLMAMDLNRYSLSAAQPGLSVETIKNLLIPLPPPAEQRAIEDFLDRNIASIDGLRHKSQQVIQRLRERRTALITAAVTGQVDVSHPAITEAAK